MRGSNTASWVLGTAFVSVLLLAGAWFFGVSPRLDAAAENATAAQDARDQADLLAIEIVQLQKDYENIDALRTELASLREQMPAGLEEAEMTRQIDALAASAGVTVKELIPSTATEMVPVVEATTEETGTEDTSSEDGAMADSATTTDTTTSSVSGLWEIPVTITIVGSYSETLAFVESLQVDNPRLFLVTSLSMTAQDEKAAGEGMPAVEKGDLETQIETFAYVVTDGLAETTDTEADADAEQEMPTPSGGDDNPFAPAT